MGCEGIEARSGEPPHTSREAVAPIRHGCQVCVCAGADAVRLLALMCDWTVALMCGSQVACQILPFCSQRALSKQEEPCSRPGIVHISVEGCSRVRAWLRRALLLAY